jgi:hypothetical protein
MIFCSRFAILLRKSGIARIRRAIEQARSSRNVRTVLVTANVHVVREVGGKCLIQRQQTAREQFM